MEELKARPVKSSSLTPLGFLERAATVYGDCPSIVYNNTTYTWSQTHRRCLQLASSIVSLRIVIKRGHDVVSVVAPNIPAMYELQFAVPMSGAILNNINTRLDARTVSTLLIHSESKLVFVDCLSLPLIIEAISLFPQHVNPPRLVLITDDEISSTDDFPDTYEGLVEKGDPNFKWVRPENEWDPMILNYTSGTTSAPKGVVHSHRGTTIAALDALIDWSVPKQPVYLWTLPMFHSNGWCFSWGMAAMGATNICLRRFDATIVYRLIEKHGVTHMCGAPVVLNMLSNSPTAKPLKNPVESVLYTHPEINEAAVVARPDEYWGETPCAFVSLKGSSNKPSENEIMEFCRARLAHYMVPKTVVFKDELPKTSTGKIQKFELRQIAKAMGSPKAPSRM
ncbi:putative acyl-activating enzyme 6 [Quercus suber]|uniref:Acyl-activating enzyme 6 n=1 Tax=Quercus suber TaxID=58331 RepID=A0AAW0KR69_QUESU